MPCGAFRALLAACAILGCFSPVSAGGDSRSATTVTAKTWESFLQGQREKQRPALVIFHVAWCKACQRVFPLFAAASDLVREKEIAMDFAHVECTDDKTLCQKFEVQGYPTIKLFFPESEKPAQKFQGQRTEAGFVKYAQRMTLPPIRSFENYEAYTKELEDESFAGFITTERRAKGLKPVAERWMDRHLIASAPELADLLPKDMLPELAVPASASFAVISLPRQQWKGALSEALPAVAFYEGPLDDEKALEEWIKKNRFPGVWALAESNFYEFTHSDQSAALVAVKEEVPEAVDQQVRGAQKSLAASYFFGVMNGSHWAEELKVFGIQPQELPRMLVSENNFEHWVEDIDELRVESMERDLQALRDGAPLLRQGRTLMAKLLFWKRQAWRWSKRMRAYAEQGPTQAATIMALAFAALVLVLLASWCFCSCCRMMWFEDEVEMQEFRQAARQLKKQN